MEHDRSALLLLADGTYFKGKAAGATGTASGEICFNTGMTGYQEIFTDPSYFGQILVTTNAHIGNYGTKSTDQESGGTKISGLVCKNFTIPYSRVSADQSIEDYFIGEKLVGISDVDTRAIVRHIRSKGAMNAIISSEILEVSELMEMMKDIPTMAGLELASKVTTPAPYFLGDSNASLKVAVYDYGIKKSILQNLSNRGCYLQIFPARHPIEEVKKWEPDGYFLSNGPGDPAAMDYAVHQAKTILRDKKPLFGICLGHQILALALGISTYKMHHGHRGINHPVKNLSTGLCEITCQNHGFGVDPKHIKQKPDLVEITHINLNDDTIEGIRAKAVKAFSVQYHPEASPGPHDARYLFDEFVSLILSEKKENVY